MMPNSASGTAASGTLEGPPPPSAPPPPVEHGQLRQEAERLQGRLEVIRARLEAVEPTAVRRVAVVDHRACQLCGVCEEACPQGAIRMIGRIDVDRTRCTGCGACVGSCPAGAIHLESGGK